MPREPKIDLVELQQMLDQGKMKQYEMADYFGVSESALSQAKAKLKRGVVENTTRTQLRRFIGKKIDAVAQMQRINMEAHKLLDLCLGWVYGDKESLRTLVGDEEEKVGLFKLKDPHELAIKIMAEIRGQLSLQLDITKTLYDMKAMQEFQEEVLKAIGEVAPDVRARIIQGLNKRRALRGTVRFK